MNKTSRVPAVLAYVPIIGWLYVYLIHRNDEFAMFHLRQSVGLVLFLIGIFVLWAVVGWLIALIPYILFDIISMPSNIKEYAEGIRYLAVAISVSLFAIVIAAYIYGVIAWVGGIINAVNYRVATLPGFGRWAETLPLR